MAAKRPPFHSMLFPAVAMLAILGALMVLPPTTPAQTYKVLYRFTGPPNDGGVAVAGPVFDRLGNLYGTTEVGGNGGCFGGTGCGTVYQLTPGSSGAWTEQVIHNFQGTDGQDIFAPVIVDGSGNLYGTTVECTTGCDGTVYELMPNGDGTWTESILHAFTDPPYGLTPLGGLLLGSGGNLYGTTSSGGPAGQGNVFSLSGPGFSSFGVLHSFTGLLHARGDGAPGFETLAADASGNLFGTTAGVPQPGSIFKLSLDQQTGHWIETVLYRFQDSNNGTDPSGGVAIDAAGNLYGTTFSGGLAGNFGVVYKLAPNPDGTWTYSVIHTFGGIPDGASPDAAPTLDRAGDVYGTTSFGGPTGQGTVFKLTPLANGTWSETLLHGFTGGDAGGIPQQGVLVFDATGNIYGAALGGTPDWGLVFEITP